MHAEIPTMSAAYMHFRRLSHQDIETYWESFATRISLSVLVWWCLRRHENLVMNLPRNVTSEQNAFASIVCPKGHIFKQ